MMSTIPEILAQSLRRDVIPWGNPINDNVRHLGRPSYDGDGERFLGSQTLQLGLFNV